MVIEYQKSLHQIDFPNVFIGLNKEKIKIFTLICLDLITSAKNNVFSVFIMNNFQQSNKIIPDFY